MKIYYFLIFITLENMTHHKCLSEEICSGAPILLEAGPTTQTLTSSVYTQSIMTSLHRCSWTISSLNDTDVITFKLDHLFTGSTSSCAYDYVIIRDGWNSNGHPLRVWCEDSVDGDTVTSYTNAIYVELVATSYDKAGIIFIMSYSATAKNRVVEGEVEFRPLNYVLLTVSAIVLMTILGGVIVLVYREVKRAREAREAKFKQMLRVRRKGISGISGVTNRQFVADDIQDYYDAKSADDTTSYTALSVTPNDDSRGFENTVSTSLSSGTPDKRVDSVSTRRVSFNENHRYTSMGSMSLTSMNSGLKIDQLLNDTSSLAKISVTSSSDTFV